MKLKGITDILPFWCWTILGFGLGIAYSVMIRGLCK